MSGAVVTKREDLAKCRGEQCSIQRCPTMSRLPVASALPVTERGMTVHRKAGPRGGCGSGREAHK